METAAKRRSYANHGHSLDLPSQRELATQILGLIMKFRRVVPNTQACANERCADCSSTHIDRVMKSIARWEPVTFVLPAFPGKSPNPAKVLGTRPDMAERQSLIFLNNICHQIEKFYEPGARIIICSDGRVFNDVVRIRDSDITQYQKDLDDLIEEIGADRLGIFNLDDVFKGSNFEAMRSALMSEYSEPIEDLKSSVRAGGDVQRLYCGITRFLFEDALLPGLTMSKTALQKECRLRAYEVIQRSKAWDVLLLNYFPDAIRLSIHPQVCGSRKIGIHLMRTSDAWLTPWHSVAVEVQGKYRLMKHAEVQLLDAKLMSRNGRPSHYIVGDMTELG